MENTEENTTQGQEDFSPRNNSGFKKYIPFAAGLLVAALAIFGAYSAGLFGGNGGAEEAATGPVAMVNGEEIARADYDERVDLTLAQYQAQGLDISEPENVDGVKAEILQSMVEETLLLQGAAKSGFIASAEEVAAGYAAIAEEYGGEEALQGILIQTGLTREDLEKDITRQTKVDKYLEQEVGLSAVAATDEEARQAYDTSIAGQDGAPAYEEIVENIKNQIKQQKRGQLVGALLERLRSESEIKILI